MRIFLALLLSVCPALAQYSAFTAYQDFEGGASGAQVTTSILDAGTHGTISWTIFPGTTQLFITNNTYDPLLRGSLLVGANLYTDLASTRNVGFRVINDDNYAFANVSPASGKVSIGFYIRIADFPHIGNSYDLVHMDGGGQYTVLNLDDNSGNGVRYRAHTRDEGPLPEIIQVTNNSTYWVTMLWDKNAGSFGEGRWMVYNPTNWLLIAATNLAHIARQNCSEIRFGKVDNHGHSLDSGTWVYLDDLIIDVTGAWYPILPPGGTVKALDTTRSRFDQAYTNAVNKAGTNRDMVLIPAGTAMWYPTYEIKKAIVISGSGSNHVTWLTNNIPAEANADEALFTFSSQYITWSNMTVSGVRWSTNYWGYGVIVGSNNCRISNILFEQIRNPVFFRTQNGLCDHCITLGSWHIGRTYGVLNGSGGASWDQLSPIAFSSTNYCTWEDFVYESTSLNPISSIAGWTSQQGDCFMVRHCTCIFDKSGQSWSPIFDQHGDHDPSLRGGLSMIVASNRFIFSAGALDGPFIDLRGGQMLAYSNYMTGEGDLANTIRLREEFDPPADGNPAHTDVVTNTYIWECWQDATHLFGIDIPNPTPGSVPSGLNSSNYIHLNIEFFTNAPGSWSVMGYPHYLTGLLVPPAPPPPPGPGPATTRVKIKGVRIR